MQPLPTQFVSSTGSPLSLEFIAGRYTNSMGNYILSQYMQLFVCLFVCFWRNSPQWARASSFTRFLDHTQRGITVGRTALDE